jgi:hypothetical protein
VERKKGGGSGASGDSGAAVALGRQARALPARWNRGLRGSGMGEKTREGEAADRWATRHSASRWIQYEFESIQMSLKDFKPFQINSNLFQFNQDLPEIKKFELKYSCEGFDESNSFLYSKFSILEMGLELKFREVKVCFLI